MGRLMCMLGVCVKERVAERRTLHLSLMCHGSRWPWRVAEGNQRSGRFVVAPGVRANSREGKVELEKGQASKKPF